MSKPTYKVYTQGKTAMVVRYSIEIKDAQNKLDAAIFPINAKYDEHTQDKRAHKFADYLNKLDEIVDDLEKDQGI